MFPKTCGQPAPLYLSLSKSCVLAKWGALLVLWVKQRYGVDLQGREGFPHLGGYRPAGGVCTVCMRPRLQNLPCTPPLQRVR